MSISILIVLATGCTGEPPSHIRLNDTRWIADPVLTCHTHWSHSLVSLTCHTDLCDAHLVGVVARLGRVYCKSGDMREW